MRSAPSIAFDFQPSRLVFAGAIAMVALAAAAPWFAGLPTSARIVLSLAVAASGVVALARYGAPRFARIAYGARGWLLVDRDGAESAADLVAHARLGSIVSLDFRAQDASPFPRAARCEQLRSGHAPPPDPAARARRSRTGRLARLACRPRTDAALSPPIAVANSLLSQTRRCRMLRLPHGAPSRRIPRPACSDPSKSSSACATRGRSGATISSRSSRWCRSSASRSA